MLVVLLLINSTLSVRHLFLNWKEMNLLRPTIELKIGSNHEKIRMKLDLSTTITEVICDENDRGQYRASGSENWSLVKCGDALVPNCDCVDDYCVDKISQRKIGKDIF